MRRSGSETGRLLALGRRAQAEGQELCLATVVHVEGSSYRKPGARMLLSSSGERVGTVSGGCLEAEVSRKAWWMTAGGAHLEQYSSFPEEDEALPYDLGCGGRVTLLLERGEAVEATLAAIESGWQHQHGLVVVHRLGERPGLAGIFAADDHGEAKGLPTGQAGADARPVFSAGTLPAPVLDASWRALQEERGAALGADGRRCAEAELPAWFVEYLPPPPAVTIFGAGEDAQPVATLADLVGWRVTVVDGRSHLARAERFPTAAVVRVLDFHDPRLSAACGLAGGGGSLPALPEAALAATIEADTFAVLMTHSFEQDRLVLAHLLRRPMRYIGVLGPRHRTERLLEDAAPAAGLSMEQAWGRLHSPVGLNLGAHDPMGIALAITAELQTVLHGRAGASRTEPEAAARR